MGKIRMPTRSSNNDRPIMRLIDVLGKRWSLRIMWELRDGRLSFRQLQQKCDGVSPTSLNQRLKDLRQLKLVDLEETGFGYTKWGHQLAEQLSILNLWAKKWDKDR